VPHRRAFLERVVGADRHVVSKHPLDTTPERLFLGRALDSVVRLDNQLIARQHVMLEWGALGRWWLVDLGHPSGVWINQTHYKATRRMLEPNDIIRFDGFDSADILFRFGVEGWMPRDQQLRAAIDEAPDDPARWEVWADFLEEQGDPLAERIRGRGPSPGDVGVASGHDWEHGFIARGNLARKGRLLAVLRSELETLLGNPFSRWMRALHVDIASFHEGSTAEETEALQVLETLAREKPSALCMLSFTLTRRPKGERLKDAFTALKRVLPKLVSDFEMLVPR
jgi:uncharacterized protein (TIGR02996 family)